MCEAKPECGDDIATQLLPSGPAWDPERVPELERVLQGVSQELARIDARGHGHRTVLMEPGVLRPRLSYRPTSLWCRTALKSMLNSPSVS